MMVASVSSKHFAISESNTNPLMSVPSFSSSLSPSSSPLLSSFLFTFSSPSLCLSVSFDDDEDEDEEDDEEEEDASGNNLWTFSSPSSLTLFGIDVSRRTNIKKIEKTEEKGKSKHFGGHQVCSSSYQPF